MKQLLTLLIVSASFPLLAQAYEIGHTTITFNDPSRTGGFGSGGGPGRQIQTEIYHPADISGTDVNLAAGEYPVVIFGHGFAMTWDAYANIWESLVPEGYIVAFPRTEGGFLPSHDEFDADLSLLVSRIQAENSSASSLFNGHVLSKTAIMGHSMGGGATILAAENNTAITTIIGLAPAETNPSAIQAASNVSVPALIFSADEDAVTPAAAHHTPIYNDLTSSCKYFINILGGGHCYYANYNFNCEFGETTSGGNITVSRAEQQTIMLRYVLPWLDLYLKTDCPKSSVFSSDLTNDVEVTYLSSCNSTFPSYDVTISLNNGTLTAMQSNTSYQWLDCDNNYTPVSGAINQSFQPNASGSWAVQIGNGTCQDTSICETVTLSHIETNNADLFEIYPNPNSGEFTVQLAIDAELTVVSSLGVIVYQDILLAGNHNLQLSCAPGSYWIKTESTSGTEVRKIFIQ